MTRLNCWRHHICESCGVLWREQAVTNSSLICTDTVILPIHNIKVNFPMSNIKAILDLFHLFITVNLSKLRSSRKNCLKISHDMCFLFGMESNLLITSNLSNVAIQWILVLLWFLPTYILLQLQTNPPHLWLCSSPLPRYPCHTLYVPKWSVGPQRQYVM